MTATPETLATAARFRAQAKEMQRQIYEQELAATEANNGKVPLPDLAEIEAEKQAAEAEAIKLADDVSKEKDAATKEQLEKSLAAVESDKAYQESLERIAKGEPTKKDSDLLAKLQEQHDKDCADMRAWLAKREGEKEPTPT
jgi:hypothetical protein